MSYFFGRRFISGTGSDGYSDHGLLSGLNDDDHLHYLIVSSLRLVESPTSGIEKTGTGSGDVFTLVNAGSGAALFIRQTGTTTDADAALDIDNTGNVGRGLSVFTSTTSPSLPLVQFSALDSLFNEPVLLITHNDPRGLALKVLGDGYISGQLDGPIGISFTPQDSNPFPLGQTGIYVKDDPFGETQFFFVDQTGYERTFGDGTTIINNYNSEGGTGDGYFPFIDVDELAMSGVGSGTVANTSGSSTSGSITRREYNNFLIGQGFLEIRGLTLRTTIDSSLIPQITYTVVKNAEFITADFPTTVLTNGIVVAENQPTTESETFISGSRKDSVIQFTTGAINLDTSPYNDNGADGYYYFIFRGNHTSDTKTITVERLVQGPYIEHIHFSYPICSFTGTQQTAVRGGQTFTVEVTTSIDGYSLAQSVQVNSGGAIQSNVALTETFIGSGIWTGTVTARAAQGNGLAEISITTTDALANVFTANTSYVGDELVLFDVDFPVIETYEELLDIIYPAGQCSLKYGDIADAYFTVTDFTEILYSSPNGRFTIDNTTTYSDHKTLIWDQGSSGIEENTASLSTANYRIRARKASNCSETTRDVQIRLDDTPPRITQIRWRRNNTGSYNLTSPTLGVGTHGVQVVFDDDLVALPEIVVKDLNKGTLSAFSGTIPGNTFTATLTVSDPSDTNGCTELQLIVAVNCSNKVPLDADPINGTDELYCVDIINPLIISVEIDVNISDGYFNDGYDGPNQLDDDIENTDNTEQACEVDFNNGIQSITASDVYTRHNETVVVTVQMADPIEAGDSCIFNASPWGASSSLSVPQLDSFLYQTTFTTNLGSTRTDDQSRAIGRASVWHATGGNATVTDAALNTDTEANIDILSAQGIDDIATAIPFATDGTIGGTFTVSTTLSKALMIGRKVKIIDNDTAATYRTVTGLTVGGTVTVDGGSLASYTVAQNATVVPLGVTDAEIQAWSTTNGLVSYINDGAFTQIMVCDFANPEAFSQHLTDEQLTQNNTGTVGLDLFRAAHWGSKLSVPNTSGGTEANPTGAASSKYVWRSKRLRLTTNPAGVQGSNVRFMLFGFSAGTTFRNVNIASTSDWDQNSSKFNLGNNDSQIDIRISVDNPNAAIPPYTDANWYKVTEFEVSPQSGFKFGKDKDINIVFNAPSTDVIDKDIYVEITLTTNSSGKAPQVDLFAFGFLA